MFSRKRFLLLMAALVYVTAACLYGMSARSRVNDWARERASRIASSPIVYATSTGGKYHKQKHYADQNHPISLYEAKEQALEACKICFHDEFFAGGVFPSLIERKADKIELVKPLSWYQYHWFLVVLIVPVGAAFFFLIYIFKKRKALKSPQFSQADITEICQEAKRHLGLET